MQNPHEDGKGQPSAFGARDVATKKEHLETRQTQEPKGPNRIKNTIATQNVVNYYAAVLLIRPPILLRPRPFVWTENVCKTNRNGIRTGVVKTQDSESLHVLNSLRVGNDYGEKRREV